MAGDTHAGLWIDTDRGSLWIKRGHPRTVSGTPPPANVNNPLSRWTA